MVDTTIFFSILPPFFMSNWSICASFLQLASPQRHVLTFNPYSKRQTIDGRHRYFAKIGRITGCSWFWQLRYQPSVTAVIVTSGKFILTAINPSILRTNFGCVFVLIRSLNSCAHSSDDSVCYFSLRRRKWHPWWWIFGCGFSTRNQICGTSPKWPKWRRKFGSSVFPM